MSDLTAPLPILLPEPPRLGQWIVWAALASLMLHAGALAFLLWQPLPDPAEAEQPAAVDVELVPPPEAAGASEPPAEETSEGEAVPETATLAETSAAGPSPPAQVAAASRSAVTGAAPEASSEAETQETAPTASAPPATETAASQPPQAEAKVAPIPLARPKVRGLAAPASAAEEGASAPTAETVESAEGVAAAASAEAFDVATLELGEPRSADRFYLEAVLNIPRMGSAREALKTLPQERRLAQTCNIEALAQIGNAGEGFNPDVVMAEAYARLELAGTRLVAPGAIFRSGEKWFGLAFDCTLSDDLTSVTAFSYQLGADVTEAVLARLNQSQPER